MSSAEWNDPGWFGPDSGLKILLAQTEDVAARHDFAPMLYTCLAIPDVCAAADPIYPSGVRVRYSRWFDEWVAPKYVDASGTARLTGETAYYLRCALIHQGRTSHEDLGYERVVFHPPTMPGQPHLTVSSGILHLHMRQFCTDIVTSARTWYEIRGSEPDVVANVQQTVSYRISADGRAYFS